MDEKFARPMKRRSGEPVAKEVPSWGLLLWLDKTDRDPERLRFDASLCIMLICVNLL